MMLPRQPRSPAGVGQRRLSNNFEKAVPVSWAFLNCLTKGDARGLTVGCDIIGRPALPPILGGVGGVHWKDTREARELVLRGEFEGLA